MASSRLSAESVLEIIFDDEVSLDKSSNDDDGNDDGNDFYGYSGASVLYRSKIESES